VTVTLLFAAVVVSWVDRVVVMWCSITQQLSGASRGQRARLINERQKVLEWSLPEVLCKTEETAHFKVGLLQSLCEHCEISR